MLDLYAAKYVPLSLVYSAFAVHFPRIRLEKFVILTEKIHEKIKFHLVPK